MNSGSIDDGAAKKQAPETALPSFVELADGHFDGWKPAEPTGDGDMDRMLGELYADIAVHYARAIQDPTFITMVMAAIFFKTTRGLIRMGDMEQAFIGRISRLSYLGSLN